MLVWLWWIRLGTPAAIAAESSIKAVELLAQNNRMIASFSRALLQNLNAHQSQEEFDQKLNDVIVKIYNASIS